MCYKQDSRKNQTNIEFITFSWQQFMVNIYFWICNLAENIRMKFGMQIVQIFSWQALKQTNLVQMFRNWYGQVSVFLAFYFNKWISKFVCLIFPVNLANFQFYIKLSPTHFRESKISFKFHASTNLNMYPKKSLKSPFY